VRTSRLFVVPPALSTHLDDIRLRASRAGLQLDVLSDRLQERGSDSRLERHILACWGDAAGTATILCSSQLSELDYEIALRLFVNSSRHVIDAS
jgi:hypothetical protein